MRPIPPMLAVSGAPFSAEGWYFEPKLDGTRCIAHLLEEGVFLQNRRLVDITFRYPELLESLRRAARVSCILDGEIVVIRKGRIDFQALQRREQQRDRLGISLLAERMPATYIAFDILALEEEETMQLPLKERKALLRKAVEESERVAIIVYTEARGVEFYRAALQEGFEGVVAKRADSTYQPGVRSREWVKMKGAIELDLVIGGITRGKGHRSSTFGALLTGAYRDGRLHYTGRVGTGFTGEELARLRAALQKQDHSPFADPPGLKGVLWVRPDTVARIRALGITSGGRLRAPVYLGTREDKPPEECTWDQIEEARRKEGRSCPPVGI